MHTDARVPGRVLLLAALTMALPVLPGSGAALAAQEGAVQERSTAERRGADLSLQRIHGTEEFEDRGFDGRWLDGERWAAVEEDDEGRSELWRVHAASGERQRWVSAEELVPPGREEPLAVQGFELSPEGRRLLLFADVEPIWRYSRRGTYWIFDLETRALRPLSEEEGPQMLAKWSPDGERIAFVRDGDLFLAELASGAERRLTEGGGDEILHGTTDWVYEEELVLWDGYRWSPDGARIAYWRFDQSPIPEFYLLDETQLYPELRPVRYPKAGTDNSRVRVGVMTLDGSEDAPGETVWLDVECWNDCYIARMEWMPGGEEVVLQVLNRHQNRLELRVGDPATGRTRTLWEETDSAWVSLEEGNPTWLEDGRFLWLSERDGWNHVYLHDRDGTPLQPLTAGAWEVSELHGVDEERGVVWIAAAYESPLGRSLLEVPLGGGEPRVVRGGRGFHEARFAPDFRHFVHVHSTIDEPPTVVLRRADGEAVRTLEENAELRERLAELELGRAEFLEVEAADGTPLNAWMLKPADFDPERRYGLLLYVYGGPGSQTVLDRWGGVRHLWHAWLADRGVLVASVDNRGTGGRGRDFKKQVYLRLGQLETEDQLAAMEQLSELPYVDADRVGIWGWSYGGYLTLLVTLAGGERVAAGASVAPVTAWQLYDTAYTERYMRTPEENPDGYREGAPLAKAEELRSPLLLVHGTADDNVHFQNTLLMVQALTEADRQFGLRIYPGKHHALPGPTTRVNLFTMVSDFLLGELGPAAATAAEAAAVGGE